MPPFEPALRKHDAAARCCKVGRPYLMEELHELHIVLLIPEMALQDPEDARLQQDAVVDCHHAHLPQSESLRLPLLDRVFNRRLRCRASPECRSLIFRWLAKLLEGSVAGRGDGKL